MYFQIACLVPRQQEARRSQLCDMALLDIGLQLSSQGNVLARLAAPASHCSFLIQNKHGWYFPFILAYDIPSSLWLLPCLQVLHATEIRKEIIRCWWYPQFSWGGVDGGLQVNRMPRRVTWELRRGAASMLWDHRGERQVGGVIWAWH